MRLLMLACSLVVAFGQNNPMRFEVESVRPTSPNRDPFAGTARSWGAEDGRVVLEHIPLKYVMFEAFGIRDYQLSGPSWLGNVPFDILATAPAGTSKQQIVQMLQVLLANRFHLRMHRETTQSAAYALSIKGNSTPTLTESKPGDWDQDGGKSTGAGAFGRFRMQLKDSMFHYEFESMTMANLADFLNQGAADLPVVDKTGLRGAYRIALDISTADLGNVAGAGDGTEPGGYTVTMSLQKLGLELVRQRLPIEKLIVDSIDKTPTEN